MAGPEPGRGVRDRARPKGRVTLMRPATGVFVQADLCDATNGRLFIESDGTVQVDAEDSFSDAACFTSLDGVSFALSGGTPLTPRNGWSGAPSGTSSPAGALTADVVHLKGAIATGGSNPVPFTLPASLRPTHVIDVPVDLCNANNGRLYITPSGVVTVQAETAFSNAQCFTSLDGVTYLASP